VWSVRMSADDDDTKRDDDDDDDDEMNGGLTCWMHMKMCAFV